MPRHFGNNEATETGDPRILIPWVTKGSLIVFCEYLKAFKKEHPLVTSGVRLMLGLQASSFGGSSKKSCLEF